MPKSKKEEVVMEAPLVIAPPTKYVYLCPACSGYAIKTSNQMLGVQINCEICQALIKLDDIKRYKKL